MIKIGTCGFSFKDWKGTVYPEKIKDRDILSYYHEVLGFDTVEIDASYYNIPSTGAVKRWVDKTDDKFLFAVKCHKDMTLNDSYHIDSVLNRNLFDSFKRSFFPVIESGRVLSFLAQFGPVFRKNKKNMEYILRFKEEFEKLPLTVEFRHKSWVSDVERNDTLDFLRRNDLGYAVVDEPQIRSLSPFLSAKTSEISYFRLHGRNKDWFKGSASTRYDYFYSDDELMSFIPFLQNLNGQGGITAVYFNNCHVGSALKNALRLKEFLGLIDKNPLDRQASQMELRLS